jgi:hypothetical protein
MAFCAKSARDGPLFEFSSLPSSENWSAFGGAVAKNLA